METSNLFDKSKEYDKMLHRGLALSGEDKYYFIRGRFNDLFLNIPKEKHIKRILDFGCGIGDSTKILAEYFTDAEIVGLDTAKDAIDFAGKIIVRMAK